MKNKNPDFEKEHGSDSKQKKSNIKKKRFLAMINGI